MNSWGLILTNCKSIEKIFLINKAFECCSALNIYLCFIILYNMKIAIGNDHAGTSYKLEIVKYLQSKDIKVTNFGTDCDDSVDYPDFVHPVAEMVSKGTVDFGIIICGSGNGASMTANKHKEIRSALCWTKEIVALARQHNNANILGLPARFISLPQAIEMVETFLNTSFDGGRHQNRIDKIPCK